MVDGGGFVYSRGRGICCGIVGVRVKRGIYSRIVFIIVCWLLGFSQRVWGWRKPPLLVTVVMVVGVHAIGGCKNEGRCGIVLSVRQRLRTSGVPSCTVQRSSLRRLVFWWCE